MPPVPGQAPSTWCNPRCRMVLSDDLTQHGANRCSIERHQFEWERHQLVHARSNASQIQIFEDRGGGPEQHCVHGETLAVPRVDRRRVHSEETKTATKKSADARLG